jgi:lincosamide nucleotidyltransferase A/C/D/E
MKAIPNKSYPNWIMNANKVVELYDVFLENGIRIWFDGGWGVDALLGRQTRAHADVDIVIQQKDIPKMRRILESRDYHDQPRNDTSGWNFVLGDDKGHDIDVHVIVFDDNGNGQYGPPEKGEMYPAASLTGEGTINGHEVNCISAEYLVKFHTGYALDENDIQNVSALCEQFDLEIPEEHRKYTQTHIGL